MQSLRPAQRPEPHEHEGDTVLIQQRVLIIEDQPSVAQALRAVVERAGMHAAWAANGAEARALARSFEPHVALVDIELPDISGIVLIRWLVAQGDCGIIVVSGHAEDADRIIGLEVGADDYVVKPPNPRELVARIRAVHRRIRLRQAGSPPAPSGKPPGPTVVAVGGMRVDLPRRLATGPSGKTVTLTAAECATLVLLIDADGRPVSREQICKVALRRPLHAEDRAVDQLIFTLRNKLTPSEDGKRFFQSVRGLGYSLHLPAQG
jgi:DNA-binding response OmpR family regulator